MVKELDEMLIKNGIIVTMDDSRRVIKDGAVFIEENKIRDLGKTSEMELQYQPDNILDAKDKIVMPGLIDGHGHSGHSLLKSLGYHNQMWYDACEKIYAEYSSKDFWEADAMLTGLERLRFGTTCGVTFFGGGDSVMRIDDPKFAEKHCEAISDLGIREILTVGPRRTPYPRKYSRWSGNSRRDYMVSFDEMLSNSRSIIERCHGMCDGRIMIALMHPTPHPEREEMKDTKLEDLKERTSKMYNVARDNELLFTMDGHSRGTIKFCHEELGLTGETSLFSHSTELTAEEIDICVETGTRIVHNPSAVASIRGRCPVPELIDAGATVMLGSDAAAPDRSYDMFRHMFQAMRYHRRYYRDPRILPPGKVLELCTIDAARGLGLDADIGSIERGKLADIIMIDMRKPHLYPLNMPVDRIVYYANGNDVDTVIVNGKILMEEGIVRTVETDEILEKAQREMDIAIERSGIKGLEETTEGYWGKSRY